MSVFHDKTRIPTSADRSDSNCGQTVRVSALAIMYMIIVLQILQKMSIKLGIDFLEPQKPVS